MYENEHFVCLCMCHVRVYIQHTPETSTAFGALHSLIRVVDSYFHWYYLSLSCFDFCFCSDWTVFLALSESEIEGEYILIHTAMHSHRYTCKKNENHLRVLPYFTYVADVVAMQLHLFFFFPFLLFFAVKCSIDAQQDLVVFAYVLILRFALYF